MPTLKEIRDDLKDVRYYYQKKETFDKAFENIALNDIFDKVNKYNDAVRSAPVRLYELYLELYVNCKSQFELSGEQGFTPDYIYQLNKKLCVFLQKHFAKEKGTAYPCKGGNK